MWTVEESDKTEMLLVKQCVKHFSEVKYVTEATRIIFH